MIRMKELGDWVYTTATNDDIFMNWFLPMGISEQYYHNVINPYLYVEYITIYSINLNIIEYEKNLEISNTVIDWITEDESDIDIPQMSVEEFVNIVKDSIVFNYY